MFDQITIVIVIYDSTDIIFDCIKNLKNFKIIIVDNGKNQKILSKIGENHNVKIISKNKNLGYGLAVNFAFEQINTKFFLTISPDLKIDENSIKELYKTSKKYSNCAVSAPILSTEKNSYGIFPEKRGLYEKNKDKIKNLNAYESILPSGEFCVDVTNGCAMLFNSEHFKSVKGFSDKYFLFWEEIDLCREFNKLKLSVIINNKATADHIGGGSSKFKLSTYFTRILHNEISPLFYFNIKKNSPHLYKNMLKYLFRSFTYLLILNFKNSLKNVAKLYANISYILKK